MPYSPDLSACGPPAQEGGPARLAPEQHRCEIAPLKKMTVAELREQ